MATGGRIGFETVAWFNGGLFDDDAALALNRSEIETTLKAAALDWSEIDPSILGTLFERGLDPAKRSQLGAHYTDRDKIMQIVEPVVIRPWLKQWERTSRDIPPPGTGGCGQVKSRADTSAGAGGTAVARLPRPTTGVHGAGSGLRIGQLPLSGAARAQGPGAPRAAGGRVDGSATRLPRCRPGQRPRHRDQPLRRRTGARLGVDRRNPVDATQRLYRRARTQSSNRSTPSNAATRSWRRMVESRIGRRPML